MLKECHVRRNRQRSSLGSFNNAGTNTSHERSRKPERRLCSVGTSWRPILRGDKTPLSITSNEIEVDSSASEHEVGDHTLLTEVEQVVNIQSKLPNGLRIASKRRRRQVLMIGSERLALRFV